MKTIIQMYEDLGDRIEVTKKTDLSPEERQAENEATYLILNVAKQMINAADVTLRAEKLAAQNHALDTSVVMRMIK